MSLIPCWGPPNGLREQENMANYFQGAKEHSLNFREQGTLSKNSCHVCVISGYYVISGRYKCFGFWSCLPRPPFHRVLYHLFIISGSFLYLHTYTHCKYVLVINHLRNFTDMKISSVVIIIIITTTITL